MSRNRPGPAGPTIDHDHSGPGQGGDQLDVGEIVADDIAIADDDTLDFGTDDDYGIRYDSGDSRLEIFSSALGDILRVADGDIAVELLGDLTVQGQTTEVDDIVTTDVDVQDAGGTSQFFIDGDAATPFIRLEDGNQLQFGTDNDVQLEFLGNVNEMRLHNAGLIVDNQEFYEGTDSAGNTTQMIGITGGDVVLVGDVAGLGIPTNIQAAGTTVLSAQPTGHANFNNGNIRVNSDGNKVQWGADQDMSARYDAGNDDLRWEDEGTSDRMALDRTTGDLSIEGTLTEGAAL